MISRKTAVASRIGGTRLRRERMALLAAAFAFVAFFFAFFVSVRVAGAQLIEIPVSHTPDVPGGRVSVAAGLRSTRVGSAGYAPFSEDKAFSETDFSGYWRVAISSKQALYAGAALGWGITDANARSATGHLEAFRAELGAQGIHAFLPFLYGVGRLGVGAMSRETTLTGEAAGTFRQKVWTPVASATAGLALRISARTVDLWFALEGGYRYAPSRQVVLTNDARSDAAIARETIDLGALSLGGPSFGARVGVFF